LQPNLVYGLEKGIKKLIPEAKRKKYTQGGFLFVCVLIKYLSSNSWLQGRNCISSLM